jgi:hypothetical protein
VSQLPNDLWIHLFSICVDWKIPFGEITQWRRYRSEEDTANRARVFRELVRRGVTIAQIGDMVGMTYHGVRKTIQGGTDSLRKVAALAKRSLTTAENETTLLAGTAVHVTTTSHTAMRVLGQSVQNSKRSITKKTNEKPTRKAA